MSGIIGDILAMSDGPHRTLDMSRAWKKVVERAYGLAYSVDDVADCIGPAISSAWKDEVPDDYANEIGQFLGCGRQTHLFERDPTEIDRLRHKASSPMASNFADHAKDIADASNLRGEAALKEAVMRTFFDRAVRGSLQAHEHCLRNAPNLRANRMRDQLQQGIRASRAALDMMAQGVAAGVTVTVRGPARRDSLDDGPMLPS